MPDFPMITVHVCSSQLYLLPLRATRAFVLVLTLALSMFMVQVYVAIDMQGSEEHHEIEMTNVICVIRKVVCHGNMLSQWQADIHCSLSVSIAGPTSAARFCQ